MNKTSRARKRGRKKRSSEGVAEFIDSAGVNSADTAVGSPPPPPEGSRRASGLGRVVEKVLSNPTLVIAGLAAIPLLFVAWGVMRRRKRCSEEDANEE